MPFDEGSLTGSIKEDTQFEADEFRAFCLSDPAVSTVIPGMRRVKNAEANAAAVNRGKNHAWDKNYYE